MEQAIELMEMLGDAEIRYAINGLLSASPPTPTRCSARRVEVRNLWSAAAVWIKEGPGIAQLVAEWMTYGYPHMCDPHGSDISRFYPHEKTEWHINARCNEHFNKTYGIVHPREQWASQRGMRRSPFYAREEALGATFFDARGWERPQWYSSNEQLMAKFPDAFTPRTHEWDARWWNPVTNAEHLQMRESVGMVDLTAFNEFDFEGPGRVRVPATTCASTTSTSPSAAACTPRCSPRTAASAATSPSSASASTTSGSSPVRSTVAATTTGSTSTSSEFNARSTASVVTFTDRSQGICTIGVWGPNAAATMAKITTDNTTAPYDLSQEGFPYGAVRDVLIDGVPCTMFRISYVGENGWEIYTRMEHGLKLWDAIWDAGQEFEIIPVGIGVYAVTGRIEKGYRLMGAELESEYNPVEAGLARPKVKSADFIGKAAYLTARAGSRERWPRRDHVHAVDGLAAVRRRLRPVPDRWQRADPHPRRRAHPRRQGPRLAGHHRRRRPVGGQVPAAGLPPAGARGRGHQAAGDVHERALPGHRRASPARRRCSIPPTRG